MNSTRESFRDHLNTMGQAYIQGLIRQFNGANRVPGQFRNINFLIDTGANRTTISIKDLLKVGYSIDYLDNNSEFDKKETALPVGMVRLKHIVIPYLLIHKRRMEEVTITIISPKEFIDNPAKDFNRNLLGTDILSLFNFTFNNEINYFELFQNLKAPKRTATIKSINFLDET